MNLITLTDEHGRLMGVNADEIAFFRESNDGRLSLISMRSGRDIFSMQTPWKIAQLIQEANTAQDTNKDDVSSSVPEVTAVADATESPPWYPKDEPNVYGPWVEFDDAHAVNAKPDDIVQWLLSDERRDHRFTGYSARVVDVSWNMPHIVAYRVQKAEMK